MVYNPGDEAVMVSTFRTNGLRQGSTLARRLEAVRRRRFVGRESEKDLFRAALLSPEPPFALLYLHGPGGIGKSSLLGELASLCLEAGAAPVLLDARSLDPSPEGFLASLRLALGLKEEASPLDALARFSGRGALMIDTYERLSPLDAWLRENFLPELPEGMLIVLASREPPVTAWRTGPGWRELVRVVALGSLGAEESRELLSRRGVASAQHPAVLAFTHGHPLALALVADVLEQNESLAFSPQAAPHVLRTLLASFVEGVPSPLHRRALEICAHVRVTTEALLQDVLDEAEVHAHFDWLRGLSFIEQGPEGLFPHDLAREVIDADLRWRHPEAYAAMHRRVRRHYRRQLHEGRERAAFDLTFLHRHNPLFRPYLDLRAEGSLYAERAQGKDSPAILEMVRRHEGEASATIAAYWLARQPEAFTVFRGSPREVAGFMAYLMLAEPAPADLEADPAIKAAWSYVRRYGPLREGEEIGYCRFGMDRERYQDVSPAVSLAMGLTLARWLTSPRLAWSFFAEPNPDFWAPVYAYIDFHPAPEADFAVGGRTYCVYAHDWRAVPAAAWFDLIAEREIGDDAGSGAPARPLAVFLESEFEEAVKRALRDYRQEARLQASPLLRSRLVTAAGGEPAALRALILEAAQSLRASPRGERLYQAVHATYLEPAASQELAAERLELPFGTYRHHLRVATKEIVAWLWRRELQGR